MDRKDIEALCSSLKAELIETHISWVLLTEKYVYKIKKPVKTSFLNFSTLSLRKKFCEQEVRLNSEITPDMYLDVIGIKKMKGVYSVGRKDKSAVEYAVKMKRLDPEKQMNTMLVTSKVKDTHIRAIAKKVALFHSKAVLVKRAKKIKEVQIEFSDLLSHERKFVRLFSKTSWEKVVSLIHEAGIFLNANASQFLLRTKNGYVRDCHGDLHSGNIFLYKDPVLFDRIEFNEQFRKIDVLHEIGFLCMDLEAHGYPDLSDLLLNYYLKYSKLKFGESERSIFNYYKSYTANVRLKVSLLKENLTGKEIKQVKKYFQLMIKYGAGNKK